MVQVGINNILRLLVLMGMQNVNPVNMQTAVNANLFPLLDAGWNSPIRSIAMNSMVVVVMRNVHFSVVEF